MSNARIRAAFEKKLSLWANTNIIPVAYEGATFAAPVGPYLSAYVLPNTTYSESLDRLHRRYMGYYQISIVMPAGKGAGAALVIAGGLETLFAPDTPLVQDGLTIWLTQPLTVSPAMQDADRYTVPCSIPYRAETTV